MSRFYGGRNRRMISELGPGEPFFEDGDHQGHRGTFTKVLRGVTTEQVGMTPAGKDHNVMRSESGSYDRRWVEALLMPEERYVLAITLSQR